MTTLAPHPAKFSDSILEVIARHIHRGQEGLDPFVGTGRIYEVADRKGAKMVGVELEPEWAHYDKRTRVGDSTKLPRTWTGRFDFIATSPCYGNRMTDHHNAQERCKACGGDGRRVLRGKADHAAANRAGLEIKGEVRNKVSTHFVDCEKCEGAGHRKYKRITYRHQLGRPLSENNAGEIPFGPRYWDLHEKVWRQCARVLKPKRKGKMILNVSNFRKTVGPKGNRREIEVDVVGWHLETLQRLGFKLEKLIAVETPRMGFGANREVRAEHEFVAILRSPLTLP